MARDSAWAESRLPRREPHAVSALQQRGPHAVSAEARRAGPSWQGAQHGLSRGYQGVNHTRYQLAQRDLYTLNECLPPLLLTYPNLFNSEMVQHRGPSSSGKYVGNAGGQSKGTIALSRGGLLSACRSSCPDWEAWPCLTVLPPTQINTLWMVENCFQTL
jgi:hypothetical protein